MKKKYGDGVLTLTLKDQYFNMRKMVEPHPQLIDKAMEAMRMAGVEPLVRPIRGGTDGARLSFMGLPCPNLFTGGMNFHGKFEYCSLTTMRKAVPGDPEPGAAVGQIAPDDGSVRISENGGGHPFGAGGRLRL